MGILSALRGYLLAVAPQAFALCLIAYFAYHAVEGGRGLRAYNELQIELDQTRAEAARVAAERAELENKVSLLRPESLDPDLLEEQARRLLNFGFPNEAIILTPKQ